MIKNVPVVDHVKKRTDWYNECHENLSNAKTWKERIDYFSKKSKNLS